MSGGGFFLQMKKSIDKVGVIIGVILASPLLLIVLYIAVEIVEYVANHATTYMQTKELTAYIEKSIEDVSIVDVYSFTGNTSGTGNHVECESIVTFDSYMSEDGCNHLVLHLETREFDLRGYCCTRV